MSCSPARKPAPLWASLHGLQFLPPASSRKGSPQPTAPFRVHLPAPVWSCPQPVGDLLHSNPPTGCRGQFASPWSSLQGCRGISARTHEAPPCPSFFTHLGVLQGCFSHTFLLLTLTDATQQFLP